MDDLMKEPLVSVIVPIYNAESFLDECIQNVKSQTYTHWELILVNDGSIDSSLQICYRYSESDSRIKVVNKENTGVSDSRNKALDIAQGDFVIFLDADDYWIDPCCLEKMLAKAVSENLDLVRGEYVAVGMKGEKLFSRHASEQKMKYAYRVLTSSEFLNYVMTGEFFLFLSLIRKSLLTDIRFETNRIFLEDMRFYSLFFLKEPRCMYLPDLRFYAYRKNESSVSFSINPKKLEDSFDMCEFFHERSLETQDKLLKGFFQVSSISMYYYTLETLADNMYYENARIYIKRFSLKQKRKLVLSWMRDYGYIEKSIIYYVNPYQGVLLFRLRHRLAKFKNRVLRCLKFQ